MDAIRDVLKSGLRRSLRALEDEDRLSAAWLVACGRALAEHGRVIAYANAQVDVEVDGGAWQEQFRSMKSELEAEMARIAGLPVAGIHFVVKR